MQTTNQNSTKLTLGAMVEKLCRQGSAVAADHTAGADLAARRLERLLVRGGNVRLATALADLAQELAPVAVGTRRHSKADRFFARAA